MKSYKVRANIDVLPSGKTEILYEIEPEVFVDEETFVKWAKEKADVLKGEVAKSKTLSKKARVKAFLKKLVAKEKGKKDAVRILKATIDAGNKALESWSPRYSKAENDASQFWSAVEVKMKVADSSSATFEFLRDWFYDVLSYEVSKEYGGGFATSYQAAPQDYIDDILSGLHKALTTSKGKMVKVWEQEVEPPYSSRVNLEQMERFQEIFPALSFEDDVEFIKEDEEEEDDYDEIPYNLEIYARSSK